MNEHIDLERIVAETLAHEGVSPPSESFYDELISRAGRFSQRPEWLALLKEPTMRTNSHLAVGSPVARFAALMVATLLAALMLAGAAFAGAQLLAADGTIVVDQNDTDAVQTISEAVAMAEDGDTILVRPGTYVEAVTIDKDITLRGDGPREDIVIEAPEDGPVHVARFWWSQTSAPYAILLADSDATVTEITFSGERSRLFADGGAPLIEDLTFDQVSSPFRGTYVVGALVINGGTAATVRGNEFIESGPLHVFEGPDVRIEANVLRDGPSIAGVFGDSTVIRDNEISGPGLEGLTFLGPTAATVEGNTITDRDLGITSFGVGEGLMPVIRDNAISGTRTAINVPRGAAPTIEGNELTDNGSAIALSSSDARVDSNVIRGGGAGIVITGGGSPTLTGNRVEEAEARGIFVGVGTSPTVIGNRVCDNGTNIVVQEGAEPVMEDNEICPDAPAEATD